jgi:hypothetical protein
MEWIVMSIPRPEDPDNIDPDMPEMWGEEEVEDDEDGDPQEN